MRRTVVRPDGTLDLMDEVLTYESSESFTEAQKVVLRLHDAFLLDPAGLSEVVRAQTLAHFSAVQIVELAMKFIQWSSNRPNVALGDDAPHDPTRLTTFHYTETGEYVPHGSRG